MQVMWYNLVHVFVLVTSTHVTSTHVTSTHVTSTHVTSTEADNDIHVENTAHSEVHILNVTSSIGNHHTTTPMWLHWALT
jgi:hypothetical protein